MRRSLTADSDDPSRSINYFAEERLKLPLIYQGQKSDKWSLTYRIFFKYLFIAAMPRFTERRTTLLSTPCSRAIWR